MYYAKRQDPLDVILGATPLNRLEDVTYWQAEFEGMRVKGKSERQRHTSCQREGSQSLMAHRKTGVLAGKLHLLHAVGANELKKPQGIHRLKARARWYVFALDTILRRPYGIERAWHRPSYHTQISHPLQIYFEFTRFLFGNEVCGQQHSDFVPDRGQCWCCRYR